ncbi:DUF2339 domain-containing protein [Pedobacter fastidiosus]|uniref:DUF2339 domain-containing protein n=1 Tax=Pedobacter fastidiosus TaxID=2765361 RepID=A0ABR7KNJ1_9SPHI|nr:DUF2339 domain-containing protein [Pedobacter fastidiosus]MBC6109653.1 DUF2339 domain-containing protein [Pedobacter fastidiosus]
MEIVLCIFILLALIIIYTKISSKFDDLSRKLSYLHDLYQTLLIKQPLPENKADGAISTEKPAEPNISEAIIEESKPIIVEEIKPEPINVFTPVIPPKKELFMDEPIMGVSTMEEKPEPISHLSAEADIPLVDETSWWDKIKEKNPDLEKFIGENLINKIGILILVLGISYFVKFAIDKNWISEPARVGIGMLVGGLIMLIAHKLRINYKAFSSVLVAGAIAVFYVIIAIAFHDYHLFGQKVAFSIMVLITAFSSLVCISYNRIELAALTLIGGFAVPFMVSTGEGNYIVLFSYIAILNIGVLSIAYFKRWMLINIQVYVFTIILFAVWLFKALNQVHPPYFGAIAFAFLFYIIFILMNILNNIKNKSTFSAIQIAILVSNTFIFYGEGLSIIANYHPELKGLFTALLSIFNLVCAWIIYKKSGNDKNVIYLLIGLSLSFITLAVPIQFKGNYITLFWAAEAVLLMWLAQKSKVVSFRFGSIIVHILMGISLVVDWINIYGNEDEVLNILINPAFISSIFSLASILAVWRLLKTEEEEEFSQFGIPFNVQVYRQWLQTCVLLSAYIAGFLEINHQAFYYLEDTYAPSSVMVLYHFLFSALLIYFQRNKTGFTQAFTIALSILNIVLFVFLFSTFAFSETESGLRLQTFGSLAYTLHFVMLLIVFYFVFFLREKREYLKINANILIWISSFLVVYLVSSELMLHVMFFSLDKISASEISKYIAENLSATSGRISRSDALQYLADSKIHDIKMLVVKTGFPILWAVLVFIFLIFGIKNKAKHLRIVALTLLGITVAKLFIYDIRNASETGKIIAFILLGVLILIISFVYQKIKNLVITDEVVENKTPTDEA